MNNEDSENMKNIIPFINQLKKKLPKIPVELVDERFTSVLAHQAMLAGGLKKKDRQNKALVDEISATIFYNPIWKGKEICVIIKIKQQTDYDFTYLCIWSACIASGG